MVTVSSTRISVLKCVSSAPSHSNAQNLTPSLELEGYQFEWHSAKPHQDSLPGRESMHEYYPNSRWTVDWCKLHIAIDVYGARKLTRLIHTQTGDYVKQAMKIWFRSWFQSWNLCSFRNAPVPTAKANVCDSKMAPLPHILLRPRLPRCMQPTTAMMPPYHLC